MGQNISHRSAKESGGTGFWPGRRQRVDEEFWLEEEQRAERICPIEAALPCQGRLGFTLLVIRPHELHYSLLNTGIH